MIIAILRLIYSALGIDPDAPDSRYPPSEIEIEISKQVSAEVKEKLSICRSDFEQAALLYPYYKELLKKEPAVSFSYTGVLTALKIPSFASPDEIWDLTWPKAGMSSSGKVWCGFTSEKEVRDFLRN